MKHITKVHTNEHEIKDKIVYNDSVLYKIDLPVDVHPKLKIGSEIEEGDLIKPKDSNVEPELKEIEYKGTTELLPGARIRVGDPLYNHKKFLKKETVVSPVSGVVKEVTEDLIKIDVQEDGDKEKTPFKSPFGGKVKNIQDKYVLLDFPGLQINLFESRGGSAAGPVRYLSAAQLRDKKKPPSHIEKSIIVTDHITAELYPMLSTLGVGAIVANTIDYALFKNMIILAVPIGIITGFGYTPNEKASLENARETTEVRPILNEDEALIKYVKSIEGKTVWLDGDYGRLIIPETREPMWVKKHKFVLKFQ